MDVSIVLHKLNWAEVIHAARTEILIKYKHEKEECFKNTRYKWEHEVRTDVIQKEERGK
jgi:hypothetical protein